MSNKNQNNFRGNYNKFDNYNYENYYGNNYGNNYQNRGGYKKKYHRGQYNNYNNKNYYNNNYNKNNNNKKFGNKFEKAEMEKYNIDTVIKTSEQGFTGAKETWFSDEEFFKNLPGHSDIEGKKDYYFNSYSSFGIHEQMLKDKIRTGTYQKAIMENANLFKDKIVLDIGCGTGILSIFAAKAGAKHVYGLEFADIADYAKEIVKRNGLSDKITIIKSKVEEAKLSVDSVDIIISEWMGYFLLYESMLDTVLFARDKWLKKDGRILPDTATLYVSALDDVTYKKNKVHFWDKVYDVDMSVIGKTLTNTPIIDVCPADLINSSTCKIFSIDLYKVKKEDLEFSNSFDLTFVRDYSSFSGLVAWFETDFKNLDKQFSLSTSPFKEATHWCQTVFYTDSDLPIKSGDKVTGSIAVLKSKANFRQLDIKISYHVVNGENTKDKPENNWYQLYKIA